MEILVLAIIFFPPSKAVKCGTLELRNLPLSLRMPLFAFLNIKCKEKQMLQLQKHADI